MDQRPTPDEALNQLMEALGPKKRESLAASIEVLRTLVEPRTSGPGSFWSDPERGAKAREAMKASWAARDKTKMQLTWRSSKAKQVLDDYNEIGRLVGRAPHTVRCMLSRGKGVAHFAHNDDVITVQRL